MSTSPGPYCPTSVRPLDMAGLIARMHRRISHATRPKSEMLRRQALATGLAAVGAGAVDSEAGHVTGLRKLHRILQEAPESPEAGPRLPATGSPLYYRRAWPMPVGVRPTAG